MNEGISYAICHVRGGGELGDDWWLAGKDANKHNTWQDDIACGEELIARGITTRDKLFIMGGSAGGITVGRAMSERPGSVRRHHRRGPRRESCCGWSSRPTVRPTFRNSAQ